MIGIFADISQNYLPLEEGGHHSRIRVTIISSAVP